LNDKFDREEAFSGLMKTLEEKKLLAVE